MKVNILEIWCLKKVIESPFESPYELEKGHMLLTIDSANIDSILL